MNACGAQSRLRRHATNAVAGISLATTAREFNVIQFKQNPF